MSLHWTDNPAFADRKPELLTPACHDRSPMLDIQCDRCGMTDHIHESQLASAPADATIGLRCSKCRRIREAPATFLRDGFAEMRRRGWIA